MSESFLAGDMVVVSDEIALPKNDLYPLVWCICDCSQNEPIAYIPYRVYTGDTVIVKSIMEGYALIPEDIGGDGYLQNLDGSITGYKNFGDSLYPSPVCNGYIYYVGSSRYYTSKCRGGGGFQSGGGVTFPPGATGIEFLGWDIYMRDGNSARMIVKSKAAYEYIDVECPGFGSDAADNLLFTSASIAPYPLKWSRLNSTTVRIEAFPGYGGTFGKANVDGGYGEIAIRIAVDGKFYPGWRRTYQDPYTKIDRTVYFTVKNTGRYGNYR